VNGTDSADWAHAAHVDARGLQCPLPVLRARKALLAAIDVPHYCSESGDRLIASDTTGGTLRFLIEKA
jgi:tRNA 2-thiouridine synthesizing protein A